MKVPLGRAPQGRAVGHQPPSSESCSQLVSSARSQTSEVGRLVSANTLFPDPALSQFPAQTWREFTVRKCSAFPAATRKEMASHSNPQKSVLLKPAFSGRLAIVIPRSAREAWTGHSPGFLILLYCWKQGSRAGFCLFVLFCFVNQRSLQKTIQ